MRRVATVLALLAAALAVGPAGATAASWHSEQPLGAGGFPSELGPVGDLECWEANRCLLITPGNSGVAAGLFAYDGSGWYRYSTVCGGSEGRIAWVGPDEFWTISDQQVGQATGNAPPSRISLCHFRDGEVVASYGEPVGIPTSYRPMAAAACATPADCWFAGERLPASGENQGAFHLHWNGSAVTAVPSQAVGEDLADPGRSVSALAFHEGDFYEAVNLQEGDVPSKAEEEAEAEFGPSLVHRIEAGAPTPFRPLFGSAAFDFGGAESPAEMQGFRFVGAAGEPLRAIAGSEGALGGVMVLELGAGGPAQLHLDDPATILEAGTAVRGAAAEPGAEAIWVAFRRSTDAGSSAPARLTRIGADGSVGPEVTLPAAGEEVGGEGLGLKGLAGPLACAAAQQCWVATSRGWLFHLGADPAPNADPKMHVLVTSRPPDDSLPTLPPIELPEDDSGGEGGSSSQEEVGGEEPLPRRTPALIAKLKQRLVDGTTLEMTFTLRARAHVRLIAKRAGKVVAKTRLYTMSKGRRSLRLRLDPDRWPTKLDLEAHELKRKHAK